MLIPTLAQLSLQQGTDLQKVAIVADVREGTFLSQFPTVWRRLKRMPRLQPSLIFLEATHAALVRRFSETRRPHPLAADRSVSEGIHDERGRLDVIRSMADEIVDTSDLTVHELRNRFLSFARDQSQRSPLIVSLVSFGFKHGVPLDADLVFDARFLPNPHFVPRLKPLTGRDKPVVRFIERHAVTQEFVEKLSDMLRFLVPQVRERGEELPDGRHRMHRRTAPFGDARRKDAARRLGARGRQGQRAAQGSGAWMKRHRLDEGRLQAPGFRLRGHGVAPDVSAISPGARSPEPGASGSHR